MSIVPVSFVGGDAGEWRVTQMHAIQGAALQEVRHIASVPEHLPNKADAVWVLRGSNTHVRYSTKAEMEVLTAKKPDLGRREATRAALIPISKNAAWWAMPQDERRRIFEEESAHIAMSLAYLPAIARRLFHCRELAEPFDFLTWFEFSPEHEPMFDELLVKLRGTKEWRYVEREVDIRLTSDGL